MSKPLQFRVFQSQCLEFRKCFIEFALLRKPPRVTEGRFRRNCPSRLGHIDCLPLCGDRLTVGRAYGGHPSKKQEKNSDQPWHAIHPYTSLSEAAFKKNGEPFQAPRRGGGVSFVLVRKRIAAQM